jgi:phage shock protein A
MSMDDESLEGLDLAAAREYILAYAVDAKRIEKEISEAKAEAGRWADRKTLAEGKLAAGDQSMAALAQAAASKAADFEGKAATLASERDELLAKVERMRQKLPMLGSRERSVDPDLLLAQLQMVTGELLGELSPSSDAQFAKLESEAKADAALEALKRRAAEGGKQ